MTLLPLNIARLRAYLLGKGRRPVVFFDVFNTLLERTVEPPDTSKVAACHALNRLLPEAMDIAQLMASRQEIEQELRQRSVGQGGDPEFLLDDLFSEWLKRWTGRIAEHHEVEQLAAAEMEIELRLVTPVPGARELAQDLARDGVRLYFVSDMYLGRERIAALLDACGYQGLFADGLVSGDVRLNKRSGRLFGHCLDLWDCRAADVVHVGDDRLADVVPARALGLRVAWFRDYRRERRFLAARTDHAQKDRNPALSGAWFTNAAISHALRSGSRHREVLYDTGLRVIGPLFANFTHRLLQQAVADRTDLLVFAAREGFMLGEIYDRFRRALPGKQPPDWVYAYVSRKSTYGASIRGIGEWERFLATQTLQPTISKLLARFSLDGLADAAELSDAGFAGPEDAIDLHDHRAEALFTDLRFSAKWRPVAERHAELLAGYLGAQGLFDADKPALVDLGWYGTIQTAINGAMRGRPEWPGLNGYYLALWQTLVDRPEYAGEMLGVLHHGGEDRKIVPIGRFAELLEAACRAPHGTTEGYSDESGRATPVLRQNGHPARQAELLDNHYVSAMQAGVFDYVDAYLELVELRDQAPEADTPFVLSLLDRVLRFPSAPEARVLSNLSHSEDVGLGLVHVAGDALKGESKPSPILWPEGYWRWKGGLPTGLAYNLFRLIARRNF